MPLAFNLAATSPNVAARAAMAGSPARTLLMASRACSRASSMPSASAAPMVVQTCLPEGERATVTKAFGTCSASP